MKKYLKIENLIYLMILLSPFLDSFSFIFRSMNKDATISPVTIIRPIIPVILAIYVFFKYKEKRRFLIVAGCIYFVYGLIHLYLYYNNMTGISYGSLLHEAQYVINYSFVALLLYIFISLSNKIDEGKLFKVLLITLGIYLLLIYLSILTGTSSTTYIEGIGLKGWNLSGNSIGTVLLLLEALVIHYIFNNGKIIMMAGLIILLLLGIFLTFLLGTRTGLFGYYIVIVAYLFGNFIIGILKNKNINIKKYILPIFIIICVGVIFVSIFGSSTLSRRKHLKNIENNIVDPNTNDVAHVTGDTVSFITMIKNNEIDDSFMSDAQKKSYLSMYEFANKHELLNNNLRTQQFIYHINLIRYQKNLALILFGNGYEINYGEMTLEMEVLALLFNFGIIGFVLYLVPFILIDFKGIKYVFKNIKKIDVKYLMYLFASFIAYVFSMLAGYTFFNISSATIIICIHLLIIKKYSVEK